MAYQILGIDPGSVCMGFAVLEERGAACELLESGVLKLDAKRDHFERMAELYHMLQDLLSRHRPDCLSIEAPFHGKNVQSMLKLGRAQGVAITAALARGMQVHEYAPRKIKRVITGNGNASKEQVAAMLKAEYRFQFNDKAMDESDAVAAAICHWQARQNPGGMGDKKSYSGWEAFLKANPGRLQQG